MNAADLDAIAVANLQRLTAGESVTAGASAAVGYYQSDGGIKYDNATSGSTGSTTSVSQALTVASNSNRIVVVMLSNDGSSGSPRTYSAVQFGGTNMTLIDSEISANINTYTYYILAPSTGSQNLTATSSGSAVVTRYSIFSYYNVVQSSPISSHSIAQSNASTTVSGSVTPGELGDLILQYFAFTEGSGSATFTNTTAPNNQQSIGGGIAGMADAGQASSLASYTLTYTSSGGGGSNPFLNYGYIAIKPLTAASLAVVNASSANNSGYSTPTTTKFRSIGFIGFFAGSASAASAVTVAVSGVASGLSSLTPGSQYYLNDTNGTIGTTAGTNTRKAGIAVDSTHLLITNIW